jgi:membrane-bound lytic murein transglycosylase B
MKLPLSFAVFLVCWFTVVPVNAAELPGIPEFIDEMVAKHHFKREELQRVFANAQYRPAVIEAISRPATAKPWLEYRAAFVNPKRIRLGVEFWKKYRLTLRRAERQYGVPQEIIVAIIGVETVYGENAGTFRTIDALTTLAFDYPRRADFFRGELEQYLLLAREQHFDPLALRSSYAGALGIPQFMPSSYRKYAVDFNGNHKVDLLRESRDAIGSVASYLQGYGWIGGEPKAGQHKDGVRSTQPVAVPARADEKFCISENATPRMLAAWSAVGVVPSVDIAQDLPARLIYFTVGESRECWLAFNNFDVITRYNNSDFYAMSVFQLAEALKAASKAEQ